MNKISIISALSSNNVIGLNGKIPWYIPKDLKRFKKITTGKVVVMGRKTFFSIGKPLPNRKNIVITSKKIKDVITYSNPSHINEDEIFVIGGELIYRYFIYKADTLYLTHIDMKIDGDTFFPEIDYTKYKKEIIGSYEYKDLRYSFINYFR